MKGRKTGGVVMNDAASKPARRNNAPKIMDAAEAMKRGGKALGKMKGDKAKANMGRAPRKSGGRTNSPFSAAAHGTPPKGHKVDGSL
jgi:hypothetical protein